jgi:hypothetical protein
LVVGVGVRRALEVVAVRVGVMAVEVAGVKV